MFLLIFATAVTAIAADFGFADWESLMPYGVGAFMLFGLGSLPAGRLGDLWGRRPMMLIFFVGMGVSMLLIAATRNAWELAAALTLMGLFSSIYHPVGIPMLVRGATRPGLTIGINGLAGNLGVAFAAVTTGFLVKYAGWRAAFVVPGLFAIACGVAFARLAPRERSAARARRANARAEGAPALARIFAVMTIAAISASLLFNFTTNGNGELLRERFAGIDRRSGAARNAARRCLRRRVVRADRDRAADRPLSDEAALSQRCRAAGAAVHRRGERQRMDALRAADRFHDRGVRRDSVHRRDDRPLRRRPAALARERHAARRILRRELGRGVAAGAGRQIGGLLDAAAGDGGVLRRSRSLRSRCYRRRGARRAAPSP